MQNVEAGVSWVSRGLSWGDGIGLGRGGFGLGFAKPKVCQGGCYFDALSVPGVWFVFACGDGEVGAKDWGGWAFFG